MLNRQSNISVEDTNPVHKLEEALNAVRESGLLRIDPNLHSAAHLVDWCGVVQAFMSEVKKHDKIARDALKAQYAPSTKSTNTIEGFVFNCHVTYYERVKETLKIATEKFVKRWRATPRITGVTTLKIVAKKR